MHSQTHRRSPGNACDVKQPNKTDQAQKYEHQSLGNTSNLIQEAETAPWFHYPLDDSFEKEFCTEFFPEIETTNAVVSDKLGKGLIAEEDRYLRFGSTNDGGNAFTASAPKESVARPQENNTMPPPKSHFMGSVLQSSSCLDNIGASDFSQLSKAAKPDLASSSCHLGHKGPGSSSKAGAAESSMMTVGSSNCGSNQIQPQTDPSNNLSNDAAGIAARLKEDSGMRLPSDRLHSKAHEGTVTSSSGGSGCSYGRTGKQNESNNQGHKRKAGDVEDSGCQSEVVLVH